MTSQAFERSAQMGSNEGCQDSWLQPIQILRGETQLGMLSLWDFGAQTDFSGTVQGL